jgi:hypothetical protein
MLVDEGNARLLVPVTIADHRLCFRVAIPLPAEQLPPVQGRNQPHHRPSPIAETIPLPPPLSRFIRLKKEKRQPHAGIAPTIPSPNQLNHSGAPHYGARGAAQRFTQSQRIFCGKRQK